MLNLQRFVPIYLLKNSYFETLFLLELYILILYYIHIYDMIFPNNRDMGHETRTQPPYMFSNNACT